MPQKHPANQHTRRQMGHLALGGLTALALVACGGGGGGDDSDSSNERSLLDVYNKLEDGMGPEEVTALVGQAAGSIGGTAYLWQVGAESLTAEFNHASGTQLSVAYWYIGAAQSQSKLFKEV